MDTGSNRPGPAEREGPSPAPSRRLRFKDCLLYTSRVLREYAYFSPELKAILEKAALMQADRISGARVLRIHDADLRPCTGL